MNIEIRDTRNGSWYWVNAAVNACKHITPIDKGVYGALCTFFGYTEVHPSYPEISKRSAISVRRCKESVQKLIERGYISVEKGGGKGNSNIYTLLKVPKGCGLCTLSNGADYDSKRCGLCTLRHPNGADCAPHIDIVDIDKEIESAPPAGVAFSLFNEIKKLEDSDRRDLNIIALYFEHRKPDLRTHNQYQLALKRHLRPAKQLVDFSDNQILTALDYAKKEYKGIYTLETLFKILTK